MSYYRLTSPTNKHLEVKLNWSEFRYDRWSAKKTSSSAVTFRDVVGALLENIPELPGIRKEGAKRLFSFRTSIDRFNQLTIYCDLAVPSILFASNQNTLELKNIGNFQLNSCNGKLEAIDPDESVTFKELFEGLATSILDSISDLAEVLQSDRQLNQSGEPITPHDDPKRCSDLRKNLDTFSETPWISGGIVGPIPKHYTKSCLDTTL